MKVHVPGDKSLSQRALILAALAEGESRLSGLVHGGDTESTAGALRAMGVPIPSLPSDGSDVRVRGVGLGGLKTPGAALDLGNSGTGARLLMGVVAGSDVEARFDGDASLRGRPMARVIAPLRIMGATFAASGESGRLPITVQGRRPLESIDWPSPVASAQVKSAILLAGLTGGAFALMTEPRQSRDHTERLLNLVGASVLSHATRGGWRVELRDPPARIDPLDMDVPGDFSSAAFPIALSAMGGAGPEVVLEGVGLNPTRTAFLDVLRRMGGDVTVDVTTRPDAVEPVGTIVVRPSSLVATAIAADEVPRLIDELPVIAILAARAEGTTVLTGASELRAKESDRIHAMVSNLRSVGVSADELPDGFVVHGTPRTLTGSVRSWDDHRIAMAFAVLGALPGNRIEVDHPEVAGVSFPGFHELIHALTAGA